MTFKSYLHSLHRSILTKQTTQLQDVTLKVQEIRLQQKEILKRNNITVRNSGDLNKLPQKEKERFIEFTMKEYELKDLLK